MALITCPECNKEISEFAPSCPNCGFPFTPAKVALIKNEPEKHGFHESYDIYEDYDPQIEEDYQKTITKPKPKIEQKKNSKIVWLVVVIPIIVWFVIIIFSTSTNIQSVPKENIEKENSSNYSSPVYKGNAENEINSYSSSSNRYVVKEEIIFAATSKTSFDLMGNCLVEGDKQALQTMLLNGQLKYLYRNDVVFLVEPKFSYYIVRQEGSTELLYVVSELLRKQ